MRTVIGGALAVGLLLAPPASAQSSSGAWNGLPDRFQVDTGYFYLKANTVLRFNGPAGGDGEVDFEKDLGLDSQVDTAWVDGTWRMGRRHQLKLNYTWINRDRGDYTLGRDFTWGGETYTAGLKATTKTGADLLGTYYRFAVFRNDRFEIGPTLGIGYLWLNAGIRATGTIGNVENPVTRTIDEKATLGSPTGAIGAYADGWLTKRLVVHGDFLYIKVTPGDSEASVTDWRIAADYYFFRHAGLGAQYKYNKYTYDRGILVSELGGALTFQGFQVFLTFLF
jgi:hypothetical protein